MNPDDATGDYFRCSYTRLILYLLNAKPLQCSQAARRQLVAVVTDPQLSVAVVTPTVHLHEQRKQHSVLGALVPTRRVRIFLRPPSPRRCPPAPSRRSARRWRPLRSCPAGCPPPSWGTAGWLWSPSPPGHSCCSPMRRPGGTWDEKTQHENSIQFW